MKVFDKRLHSCPMCGSTEIYLEEKHFGSSVEIYIGCAECGLRGHKGFLSIAKDKTEKAIEYWNHRVSATVPTEDFNPHKTVVGKRIEWGMMNEN